LLGAPLQELVELRPADREIDLEADGAGVLKRLAWAPENAVEDLSDSTHGDGIVLRGEELLKSDERLVHELREALSAAELDLLALGSDLRGTREAPRERSWAVSLWPGIVVESAGTWWR
jgi:hypothetical protein